MQAEAGTTNEARWCFQALCAMQGNEQAAALGVRGRRARGERRASAALHAGAHAAAVLARGRAIRRALAQRYRSASPRARASQARPESSQSLARGRAQAAGER